MRTVDGRKIRTIADMVRLEQKLHHAMEHYAERYGMGFCVVSLVRDWLKWRKRQALQLGDGTVFETGLDY
jgi:hypothetical protein